MSRRRPIAIATGLLLFASTVWAAVYTYDKGFTKKWRSIITKEFDRRGIEAEIGKLTLDPFEGLVARNVRFYQDDKRDRLLATINHIALDIDLAKLVRNEDFLNTIAINNADLSLPLNPDEPKSKRLKLSNLSAHLTMAANTINISSVTGNLYGIDFNINGTLLKLPEKDEAEDQDESDKDKTGNPLADALKHIHQRQSAIRAGISFIESFDFSPEFTPTIDIDFTGDLADLATATARAEINARDLGYKTLLAKSLSSVIEFHDGTTELKRFNLTDDKGRLSIFGRYNPGKPSVPFTIESTINVHALAAAFTDSPALGEVVFYAPPVINVEGTIDLSGERHPSPLWHTDLPQITAVGNVATSTVLSRGTIFESISFDFSYRPDALYIRNATIGHKSGNSTFQVLHQSGEDLKWKARIATHPSAFAPFTKERTRKLLDRIGTSENTHIRIDATGNGPAHDKRLWEIRSTIEARDFTFNAVPVSRLDTKLDMFDRVYTFSDVHVTRPDGIIAANQAVLDSNNHTVTIDSGSSSTDPTISAKLFSEKLAEILTRYPFSQPPTGQFSGVIDVRIPPPVGPMPPNQTDLEVEFVSTGGTFGYTIAEQDLQFTEARGRLRLLGRDVGLNLAGRAVPATTFKMAELDSGADVAFQGWVQKKAGKLQTDLTLTIANAGNAHYELLGSRLALRSPTGTLKFTNDRIDIDITSQIAPGSSFRDIDFTSGASFTAKGWHALGTKESDLVTSVTSKGDASYTFLGKQLPLTDTVADFHLTGASMDMEISSGIFGGRATTTAKFAGIGTGDTPYTATLRVADVRLAEVAAVYSPSQKTQGSLTAGFDFSGKLGAPLSLAGAGTASLRDGNIYAFPIFGPLSPVVSLTLTDKSAGYSVAREGTAQFSVADGTVTLGSFEALTPTFRLTAAGTIDYHNDALDLNARLNARGAAGILLFPVSKLLEYHGTGSIKNPDWRPALTSSPSRPDR